MSIRRSTRIRTALSGLVTAGLLAAGLVAAGLTGAATATAAGTATAGTAASTATAAGDPLPDQRAAGVPWPAELTEHTRLFVNPYRSYLVQERDGVLTLVLSTGWDSCYFMTQQGQQRYPC